MMRDVHIGTRAIEIDCICNARELRPVSKISVEPHSSFYVFEGDVLGAALDDDVGTNLRESSGTVIQVEAGAASEVANRNVAIVAGDVSAAVASHDADVAMARR